MTKAMPFLQKAILLSYDPRRFCTGCFSSLHLKIQIYALVSPPSTTSSSS